LASKKIKQTKNGYRVCTKIVHQKHKYQRRQYMTSEQSRFIVFPM